MPVVSLDRLIALQQRPDGIRNVREVSPRRAAADHIRSVFSPTSYVPRHAQVRHP